jgi:hypothetical protein
MPVTTTLASTRGQQDPTLIDQPEEGPRQHGKPQGGREGLQWQVGHTQI